jgi:hypothetical protein
MVFPSMSGIKIDTGKSGKLIILGGLIGTGLIILIIGLITFFSGYSYYNKQISSMNALIAYQTTNSKDSFTYLTTNQAALAMAQQMAKYLWTKNDVYAFAEKLTIYKNSSMTIGQEQNQNLSAPDGTTYSLKTMTISFGAVMDLNSFLELYSQIETDQRVTTIQPVLVDALTSLKQIAITFYLIPDGVLPDISYPLVKSDVYALSYATPTNGTGKIPIFLGGRILYGVFDSAKLYSSGSNPPDIPTGMISLVSPVIGN